MPDTGIPISTNASSRPEKTPGQLSQRTVTIIRWVSLGLILAAVLLFMRALPTGKLLGLAQTWIEGLGIWGPLALGAIYILATLLFIPGSALTLVAAAIYGLLKGLVIVSISSTTAAALAFLIARYFARDKVRNWIEQSPKLAAVDEAIGEQGWKIVALLRLSPAVPFNLQNYLYGVTSIRFWPCVLTSWVAMLPGTFMYVYLGSLGGSAAAGRETSAAQWALRIVGLLATIGVSFYIAKLARNAIQERTAIVEQEDQQNESAHVSDGSSDANKQGTGNGKLFALLAASVMLFGLSLWAFFQRDAVKRYFESLLTTSPTVASWEAYDTIPEESYLNDSLRRKSL